MKKIIIANWKMNPRTPKEARHIFEILKKKASKLKNVEVVVVPSFVHLAEFSGRLGKLKLGAQDVFFKDPPGGVGAFTGEISSRMLKDLEVSYVIIGHSERRENLGESDDIINKKLKSAYARGLKAVLCVGEREQNKDSFPEIVRSQLKNALSGVPRRCASRLLVAYEPVWAISTTKGAKVDNPQNLFEMAIFIRRALLDIWGKKAALRIPILYGGSVNSKNAKSFLEVEGISGLLVGGASIRPKEFSGILEAAKKR